MEPCFVGSSLKLRLHAKILLSLSSQNKRQGGTIEFLFITELHYSVTGNSKAGWFRSHCGSRQCLCWAVANWYRSPARSWDDKSKTTNPPRRRAFGVSAITTEEVRWSCVNNWKCNTAGNRKFPAPTGRLWSAIGGELKNIQQERIQQACVFLKLDAITNGGSAISDKASTNDRTLADFLELLLQTEI